MITIIVIIATNATRMSSKTQNIAESATDVPRILTTTAFGLTIVLVKVLRRPSEKVFKPLAAKLMRGINILTKK